MKPVLLLTRAREDAERFAAVVRDQLGFEGEIRVVPLMRIEPLVEELDLAQTSRLIFTSRHGIQVAAKATSDRSQTAYCVGASTAEAANAVGWQAEVAGGTAETLIQRILADQPDGPLLHLRGEHARGHVADRLNDFELETKEQVIYRQVDLENTDLGGFDTETRVIAPVFSPKSAKRLARAWGGDAPIQPIAFSAAVAETLAEQSLPAFAIAKEPTVTSMLDALKTCLDPL